MSKPLLPEFPEPCTHQHSARRNGRDHCDDCERKRTDAAIKRAGDALKRLERQAEQ